MKNEVKSSAGYQRVLKIEAEELLKKTFIDLLNSEDIADKERLLRQFERQVWYLHGLQRKYMGDPIYGT